MNKSILYQPTSEPKTTKNNLFFLVYPILITVTFFYLWRDNSTTVRKNNLSDIVIDWNKHALECDRYAEGYNAPRAARTYAYIGLAAYEAAIPATLHKYHSVGVLFPELALPTWNKQQQFYLPAALSGCYNIIFDKLFARVPSKTLTERQKIVHKWELFCLQHIDKTTYEQSKVFGEKVALAVYEWAATDVIGNQANIPNMHGIQNTPQSAGKWIPSQDFPMPPLLPEWGGARTFLINVKDCIAKPPTNYSISPDSPYYMQALEVFTMSTPHSFENKWVAEFWSDDHHGLTFSPAGRWVAIANQVIEKNAPSVEKMLETYLRIGFALNDAFVACWYSKYLYNLERPETFIKKVFDPSWQSLGHTPPFPAYPSGHATVGAAAAAVLTHLYGENYEMTDNSHIGRMEFNGTPRNFRSFSEMAYENAFSRIPLGVHFRRDCDEGLRLGKLIGNQQDKLNFIIQQIEVK